MSKIIHGDCLEVLRGLASGSVHTCVTSPPYWGLRDYGVPGQFGLDPTPEEYVANMVEVFREIRRVLRDDGTLWVNLGDSYTASKSTSGGCSPRSTLGGGGGRYRTGSKNEAMHKQGTGRSLRHGLKPKDLVGIPWRVAFALQAGGWYLRQDIIWHKPNPMPESVRDRCTKAHEYIFLLSKSERYYFDADAVKEPAADGETRNRRSVWTVTTKPFKGAHFATFPPDLIEPCVLAGAPVGGTVIDPFFGAGTTGLVAAKHGRKCIGIELNPDYVTIANARLGKHE